MRLLISSVLLLIMISCTSSKSVNAKPEDSSVTIANGEDTPVTIEAKKPTATIHE